MCSITYLASEKLVRKFVETNGGLGPGLLVDILKLQHFTGCNSEVRLPPCVDRVMHGFTKYFRSTNVLFYNLYSRYYTFFFLRVRQFSIFCFCAVAGGRNRRICT